MRNFISPIPIVVTDDPPMPLTAHAEMGQSMKKSDFSGEIWTVIPVSM